MAFLTAFLSIIFNFLSSGKKGERRPVSEEDKAERVKNYPPAFPNGWYNLCSAESLGKGQVKEVEAFGQKFAVYRGESGKVAVMDIYCPHLNANLADGWVKGDRLVCPFHGWEFNTGGKCMHIPYSDQKPPEKARIKTWEIKEHWGLILMWHHAGGKAPQWSPDGYLKELETYKYHGYTSDILHIHLQDFAENGADYAHFDFVHNLLTIPHASKFVHLKHKVEINFGEGDEKHMAWFKDTAQLSWNKSGKVIDNAGGHAVVTYFGPGFLAFKLNSKLAKDVILLKTFTPLGPLKLRMDDYVFAPKGTNRFALKYILKESSSQFHDDILIWERKGFNQKPMLVKGDGPIMKMRYWYRQFYDMTVTENLAEEEVGKKTWSN